MVQESETIPAEIVPTPALVTYGAHGNRATLPITVPLTVLWGEPMELWPPQAGAATFENHPTVPHFMGKDMMFGRVVVGDGPLQQVVRQAYLDLLDFIAHEHPELSLWRVWNYIPDITAPDHTGTERYRSFNIGRYEALMEHCSGIHKPPAATAIGLFGGDPILYFLAGSRPGQPIENPRQISAYHYPEQYGPRSPNFSRAMLADIGERRMVFISGTASIIGHESRHIGNVVNQTRETIANLTTLLGEAAQYDFTADDEGLYLTIYVRHAIHLDTVWHEVKMAFPRAHCLYLHAEICRPELLVEIEARAAGR